MDWKINFAYLPPQRSKVLQFPTESLVKLVIFVQQINLLYLRSTIYFNIRENLELH